MSRYLLVPVEGFDKQAKELTIPDGLVVNSYEYLFKHVSDKDKLKNLLFRLSKSEITPNERGIVKHKDNILDGVIFNNAVIDSCNGQYLECYEPFYELLRKFGIVF